MIEIIVPITIMIVFLIYGTVEELKHRRRINKLRKIYPILRRDKLPVR